jgi:glycosyltransferase involved in cell wall biosynthesis
MACGAPTIALGTSSVPEVTSDAAALVPPSTDAETFAAEIYAILSSEQRRQALIDKGLKRAKLFKWGVAAQQLLSLYKRFQR